MSTGEDKDVRKAASRMKVHFVIAAILLVIMDLLSSLGDAFLYVLGGLSFFFSFLAWQNWRRTLRKEDFSHYNRSERGNTFIDNLKSAFTTKTRPEATRSPVANQGKRIIFFAASFVGGRFMVIIFIIIFTSGDDGESSGSFEVVQDADNLFSSGNYDAAYAEYRKGISEDAGYAGGYYGIGNIKTILKESDSALYYYDKALEIEPEMFDAAYGKALVFFNEQNYSKSNEELKYIFNKTDDYLNAYLLAGDNHYFVKEYDQAIEYYEGAYERGARSKELSNIMAYIYDVKGDQIRAIEFYKETLQYDSSMTDVYVRLGELIPGEEGNVYRQNAGRQW